MKLEELQALCAMAKSAGINDFGDLYFLSKLYECKTNDDLMCAVETVWENKRLEVIE